MTGRVVMLLSNAYVSDPRVEKEAAALSSAGFEVTVIAWDRAGDSPPTEERDGIRIERIGPRARHGGGLANIGAYREFWRAARQRAVELNPDVVHCHDLDTAPAARKAVQRVAGARLVLDFHELYRESNMLPQRGAVGVAARAAVRAVEARNIPQADAVLVANPGTVDYYRRFGVADRLVVVENAPDSEMFRPRGERSSSGEGGLTIGYFGQKRYVGGLRTLMEAIQPHEDLFALLAGGGTGAEEVARIASGMSRVEDHGRFTYDELPGYYARCDAVYAVYEADIGNVRTLFPVKVMEAMACALPSIVSEGTWAGDYVEREGVGIAVAPGDRAALEAALLRLRDDAGSREEMGRRGRALVESGLDWASASKRLLGAYRRILE